MLTDKTYANGQRMNELQGNRLIWYYKDGVVKAEGPYENDQMEGEWRFYRATGQLWQVAHFLHNQKHGLWTRYDRNDQVEYRVEFAHDKPIKRTPTP